MKIKIFVALALAITTIVSCKTPQDIIYYQDTTPLNVDSIAKAVWNVASPSKIRLQGGDKLSIMVSSPTTPELAPAFNKGLAAYAKDGTPMSTDNVAPYRLDKAGNIVLPMVGEVNLMGLSRAEVTTKIEDLLRTQRHINDAVVTVQLLNQYVSVLGEVQSVGRVDFERDFMTINEALSRCGDMTINAERKHVLVLRQEGNQVKHYQLDFTQAHQLAASPAYHLQPGDVVYVTPNKYRIRESNEYGNTWKKPYIYTSLVSVVASIVSLIIIL